MSIWSDRDIVRHMEAGDMGIDPWDFNSLQPASVDLRLGCEFWRYKSVPPYPYFDSISILHKHIDFLESFTVENGELLIHPGEFLLGATKEKISLADNVVGRIEGKSSLARLGLTVHQTGGFIDPGNKDLRITLEMVNHSPVAIKLYTGMYISQIAFENTVSPCERPYGPERGSRYYADGGPRPSRIGEKLGI